MPHREVGEVGPDVAELPVLAMRAQVGDVVAEAVERFEQRVDVPDDRPRGDAEQAAAHPVGLAEEEVAHDAEAAALGNGAPFKDWVLPAAFGRVRRKLAGADDGDRQMVGLLTAAMDDGLDAVEAACLEAIEAGVHSADVVLDILARRREPARVITIDTPDALRLQHEPVADCARYDTLRSIT